MRRLVLLLALSWGQRLLSDLVLRVDGGVRQGKAGTGGVLEATPCPGQGDGQGDGPASGRLWTGSLYLGPGVAPLEAEYEALVEGLVALRRLLLTEEGLAERPIIIETDSAAVVRNLNSSRPVDLRDSRLARLHRRAESLLASTGGHLRHLPREQNREADALAGGAIVSRESSGSVCLSCPLRLLAVRVGGDPRALTASALSRLRVRVSAQECGLSFPLGPQFRQEENTESVEVLGSPAHAEVSLEDLDTGEVILTHQVKLPHAAEDQSSGNLWRRVSLPSSGSSRLGPVPSLAVDFALIALDSIPVLHGTALLADTELLAQVLRAVGRLGRMRWLFASPFEGKLLLERSTALPSRSSTRLCLSIADLDCFAGRDPKTFVERVPCPLQRDVLSRWLRQRGVSLA